MKKKHTQAKKANRRQGGASIPKNWKRIDPWGLAQVHILRANAIMNMSTGKKWD